jgi:hypothetical protein
VCFLVSSFLSTPLNLVLNGGRSLVPLGDSLFAALVAARLPLPVAAYVAEAAIDLPDKLIAVVAAVLFYRALPAQPVASRVRVLDVGASFTFVFRSRRWLAKMLGGALCILLSPLVVPFLLFMGYVVAIARGARRGEHELPAWRPLRARLADGFGITVLFGLWYLPGVILLELAGNVIHGATGALDALSGVWGLLVLFAQPAIWSQYLQHGFRGGFDVGAIVRRIRLNPGLTSVVGVLAAGLAALALSGLAVVVGVVLTVPYATWVAAHLVGEFSALTDEPAELAA